MAAGGHRGRVRLQGAVVMTYTHQEHVHVARQRISEDARWPRPGFKSTAVYFEWLAQKETRDYDRRQRLLELARFYRSLAGIIPGMPEKYNDNGIGLPLTRAARWHARAEECNFWRAPWRRGRDDRAGDRDRDRHHRGRGDWICLIEGKERAS